LSGNYNYSKLNKYRSATSTFASKKQPLSPRAKATSDRHRRPRTFYLATTPQIASSPQQTRPHESLQSSTTIEFSPKISKCNLTVPPTWLRLALVCMPGHRHSLCTIRLARSLEDGRSSCALSKAPFMSTSLCQSFCMRRGQR
jgi:hypothetical protein